jgi:hypothetical protein
MWLLGRIWNFFLERYDSKRKFHSLPQVENCGQKLSQVRQPTNRAAFLPIRSHFWANLK